MTSKIRFATTADTPAVLEIYGPFCEDSPISFETERPSVSEIERRIRKIVERFPWLICENENEVLGYAYAGPHRDRAAYRWSVDVAIFGQGFGTALYTVLFELLRIQGYFKAYAICIPFVCLHRCTARDCQFWFLSANPDFRFAS
jgi:L-amino acid N-acyltransferase YncA